jgi:hypothetical protein
LPAEFVAKTKTEYVVPFVRPVIVQLVPPVVHDAPPGEAVAVYEEIAAPPSDPDGDHEAEIDWLPGARFGVPGALGGVGGGVTPSTAPGGQSPFGPVAYSPPITPSFDEPSIPEFSAVG